MESPRQPLGPLTPNTLVAPTSSLGGAVPPPKTQSRIAEEQKCRLLGTAADKRLLDAVSKSADCMIQLGHAGPGRFQAASGAAALQALGYGVDSRGAATYNPQAGAISRRLAELESALQVEQDLVREGCGLYRATKEHMTAMRAEECARSAALEASQRQLADAAQQMAAGRAAAAQREQQLLDELNAAVAQSTKFAAEVAQLKAELEAAGRALLEEQREGARREERLAAANMIREKWRGRSRRAREELAFKKKTLELASEWSAHFESLLNGRAPPEQEHLRAGGVPAALPEVQVAQVPLAPRRARLVRRRVPH